MDYFDRLIWKLKTQKKMPKRINPMTADEEEVIKEMYPTYKLKDILKEINRQRYKDKLDKCSIGWINKKAEELGLERKRKIVKVKQKVDSEFVDMEDFYEAYRF